MNKQEVIEKIEACKSPFTSEDDTIFNYGLGKALSIIKQLDAPKKPVVPQFVADWYEERKDNFENELSFLIYSYFKGEIEDNLLLWFGYDFNKTEPIQTLVNMHKFGYEVEKEKLYTVELPNPHGLGHTVLVKDMYENTFITYTTNSNWREGKVNQLTEAEIKKDFDWAWQFAKEVEE